MRPRWLLPGIGAALLAAVIAVVVVASFFIVIANLVVDIAYAFIDPRVRYQ